MVDRTVTPRATPQGYNPSAGISQEAQRTGQTVAREAERLGAQYVNDVNLQAEIAKDTSRQVQQIYRQSFAQQKESVGAGVRQQMSGLEALSNGIAQFVGGVQKGFSNLQVLNKAKMDEEYRKKEVAEQNNAEFDWYARREADPDGGDTYLETYATLKGGADGDQLAAEFIQMAETQIPLDADIEAAAEEFWNQEVAGAYAQGQHSTDEMKHFTEVGKSFFAGIDSFVNSRQKQSTSYQLTQGKTLVTEKAFKLGAKGDFTMGDINMLLENAQGMYIDDPAQAKTAVLTALIDGARTQGGDAVEYVQTFMEKEKGYGPNGETFAEWRPQQWSNLNKHLHKIWNEEIDIRAAQHREVTAAMIRGISDPGLALEERESRITNAYASLVRGESRWGSPAKYADMKEKLRVEMDKYSFDLAEMELYDQYLKTDNAAFPGEEVIKKQQDGYIRNKLGIDYRTTTDIAEINSVAGHVFSAQAISPDVKKSFNRRLLDLRNRDNALAGFNFFNSLYNQDPTHNKRFFNQAISKEAKAYFSVLQQATNNGAMEPGMALEALAQNPNIAADMSKFNLATFSGHEDDAIGKAKASASLELKIRDNVATGWSKWFSRAGALVSDAETGNALLGNIDISDEIKQRIIQDIAYQSAVAENAGFKLDHDEIIDQAVQRGLANADQVPAPYGRTRLIPRATETVQDADGKAIPVVPMGTDVVNPHTKEAENTVETFQEDAQLLVDSLENAETGLDLGEGEFSLMPGEFTSNGRYTVMVDGKPVHLKVGQEMTVTVPDFDQLQPIDSPWSEMQSRERMTVKFGQNWNGDADPEFAKQHLLAAMGIDSSEQTGIEFVMNDAGYATLVYKGRFKGVTVDEKEEQFVPADETTEDLDGDTPVEPTSAVVSMLPSVSSTNQTQARAGNNAFLKAREKMTTGMLTRLKRAGLVPQGVNLLQPDVADPFLVLDDAIQNQIITKGGTALDVATAPVSESYGNRRYQMIKAKEGFKNFSYDDVGYRSIGLGFNMTGRNDSKTAFRDLFGITGQDYQDVVNGKKGLSERQVRQLFDYTANIIERDIDRDFQGIALKEHERLALFSIAYNRPSQYKELIPLVKAGDRRKVAEHIRKHTNPKNLKVIWGRAAKEARLFYGAS
ncbi:hypothetical protein [Roseibium alexandrii]|nr:hypothetical protein [Roseibium alexandrii]